MVSDGSSTVTLIEQRGTVLPDGQLLPGAVVDSVLAMTLLPVSGFLTVTVPVIVTVPPTGIDPVQVTPLPLMTSVPEVAVWSPLGTASSKTLLASVVIVIPV